MDVPQLPTSSYRQPLAGYISYSSRTCSHHRASADTPRPELAFNCTSARLSITSLARHAYSGPGLLLPTEPLPSANEEPIRTSLRRVADASLDPRPSSGRKPQPARLYSTTPSTLHPRGWLQLATRSSAYPSSFLLSPPSLTMAVVPISCTRASFASPILPAMAHLHPG